MEVFVLLEEHVVTVCPLEFVVLPFVVPVAQAVSPGLLMIVVLFVVVVVHVPPEQLVVPLCVVVVDDPSGLLTSVVPFPGAGASLGLSLPVGAQTLTPLISPGPAQPDTALERVCSEMDSTACSQSLSSSKTASP